MNNSTTTGVFISSILFSYCAYILRPKRDANIASAIMGVSFFIFSHQCLVSLGLFVVFRLKVNHSVA